MIRFNIIIQYGKSETVNYHVLAVNSLGAMNKLELMKPLIFSDPLVTEIIIRPL